MRWVHDIFDQLIEAAHIRPKARKAISGILLTLLLERISEDLRSGPHFSHARQTYDHCRRYLAENYMRIRSLSDAARSCGVSAAHLSRLFHRFDTELPNAFLLRLKMDHAAELILRGSLPVKAAAAQLGFGDPYHFSRCFKRVHGVAPSFFGRHTTRVVNALRINRTPKLEKHRFQRKALAEQRRSASDDYVPENPRPA